MPEKITLIPVEQLTELELTCPQCHKTAIFYPAQLPIRGMCPHCPTQYYFGLSPGALEEVLSQFGRICSTLAGWNLNARFRYKAET